MKIMAFEIFEAIKSAAAEKDVEKLQALRGELDGIDIFISSPNASASAFIFAIDAILWVQVGGEKYEQPKSDYVSYVSAQGVAFDVTLALIRIGKATINRNIKGLRRLQTHFANVEKWTNGKKAKFALTPTDFSELIDAILEILPDAEVVEKIEESEEPAEEEELKNPAVAGIETTTPAEERPATAIPAANQPKPRKRRFDWLFR